MKVSSETCMLTNLHTSSMHRLHVATRCYRTEFVWQVITRVELAGEVTPAWLWSGSGACMQAAVSRDRDTPVLR